MELEEALLNIKYVSVNNFYCNNCQDRDCIPGRRVQAAGFKFFNFNKEQGTNGVIYIFRYNDKVLSYTVLAYGLKRDENFYKIHEFIALHLGNRK